MFVGVVMCYELGHVLKMALNFEVEVQRKTEIDMEEFVVKDNVKVVLSS